MARRFVHPGSAPIGRALVLGAMLALPLTGQNLVSYDLAANTYVESPALSQLYPAGGPVLFLWPTLAPLLPVTPVFAPPGAVTIDGTTGLAWTTNGALIEASPHLMYPPLAAPVPPFPAPPVFGGPVTGMAIDPLAGVLWMTDGLMVGGFAAVPGAPMLFPPFPVMAPAAPITGLEWDPLTASLWAIDIQGLAWNFLPGGTVIGPPIPAPAPLPAPPTGIAIDKTGLSLPGAPRSLYVVDATGLVQDLMTGTVFPSGAFAADGLTMHPAPQPSPPTVCTCPGMPFNWNLTGPATSGVPTFGIDLTGLPPNQAVVWMFDLRLNPVRPIINGVGCPLGVNPGTWSWFSLAGATNATGTASMPMSLATIPPGVLLYLQPITFCTADPIGLVLAPTLRIAVSAP